MARQRPKQKLLWLRKAAALTAKAVVSAAVLRGRQGPGHCGGGQDHGLGTTAVKAAPVAKEVATAAVDVAVAVATEACPNSSWQQRSWLLGPLPPRLLPWRDVAAVGAATA